MADGHEKYLVYVPTVDDQIKTAVDELIRRKPWLTQVPRGRGQLKRVNKRTALYVFGHGNLGKCIGTHTAFSNPDELAEIMRLDGLPDVACDIKLWACNSGVRMPGFKASYASLFSEALRKVGYKKPRVHGYIGFALTKVFYETNKKLVKLGSDEDLYPAKDSKTRFQVGKRGTDTHEGSIVKGDGNNIDDWKIVPIP